MIAQDAVGSGQAQQSGRRVRIQLYGVLADMDGHLGPSILNEKPSQPEPRLNGAGAQINRPLERRFRHVTLAGPRHEQHQSVGSLDLGIARKEPSRTLNKRQAFAGKSRVVSCHLNVGKSERTQVFRTLFKARSGRMCFADQLRIPGRAASWQRSSCRAL